MKSETTIKHQSKSSKDISCAVITLSDSRKSKKVDESGKIISQEIESRYLLKSRILIKKI